MPWGLVKFNGIDELFRIQQLQGVPKEYWVIFGSRIQSILESEKSAAVRAG